MLDLLRSGAIRLAIGPLHPPGAAAPDLSEVTAIAPDEETPGT